MSKLKIFARFLLVLPILEILGFVIAGSMFGIMPTLLAFIATTALGIFILRKHQWLIIEEMQGQLRQGYLAADTMAANGFMIIAGILLIIPGFITDILGILCLVPAIRSGLFKKMLAYGWLKQNPEHSSNPRVIEGEAKRIDEP